MRIEGVIRRIYGNYLSKHMQDKSTCPDEETLTSFCEGLLNAAQSRKIEAHLAACSHCSEIVALYNKVNVGYEQSVPLHLIESSKAMVQEGFATNILEVILGLKEKTLELLSTTGDIIRGDEIMPLPLLRSRGIREFKEEIVLIKEFQGIKITLSIEKEGKEKIRINVLLSDRKTLQPITDLRVALFKDNIELESYLAKSGAATFEGLVCGVYILEISRQENRIGIIKIEIN